MSTDLSQRASSRLQSLPVSQEQRTQEAKEAFQAHLKSSGAAIDNELQERAKIIHANAKELDKQDKQAKKDTKQLNKESDAMEKFLTKSRKVMPDIDSFEAEMAKIEADLNIFDEMLDDVERPDYENVAEGNLDRSQGEPAADHLSEPSKSDSRPPATSMCLDVCNSQDTFTQAGCTRSAAAGEDQGDNKSSLAF